MQAFCQKVYQTRHLNPARRWTGSTWEPVEKQSRNTPKKDDEILHVISATESTSRLSSFSAGLTFSNAAQHSAAPFLDFITKRKIMGKKRSFNRMQSNSHQHCCNYLQICSVTCQTPIRANNRRVKQESCCGTWWGTWEGLFLCSNSPHLGCLSFPIPASAAKEEEKILQNITEATTISLS